MGDSFGDRIKKYESISDFKLVDRLPIIVRLDGNSFSKFTSKFEKPFDQIFTEAMWSATKAVLNYCSGAQVGYTQSDEITILLTNDMTLETQPFLGNRIGKLCSLLASTCSVEFNKYMFEARKDVPLTSAIFDCRVFIVPPAEVNNVFLWRQQDAFKNCVSTVAHYGLIDKYGRKTAQRMLYKQNNSQQQEIIFKELGINMNDYPTKWKRGSCIVKEKVYTPIEDLLSPEKIIKLNKQGEVIERSIWVVDQEIPLFNQDTNYIEKFLLNNKNN